MTIDTPRDFTVLYRPADDPFGRPSVFHVSEAFNYDHAEEIFEAYNATHRILGIYDGHLDWNVAFDEYMEENEC